jgi:hypothetical protein
MTVGIVGTDNPGEQRFGEISIEVSADFLIAPDY